MPRRVTPRLRSYWDACVFLSYINGDTDRSADLERLLEASHDGRIEIVTSMVSMVEVARGAQEQAGQVDATVTARIDALWTPPSPIKLVEFHIVIASAARDLIRIGIGHGWSLKPMDAIHLATAANVRAGELLTYDAPLEKYADLISVPIVRSSSDSSVANS